MPLKNKNSKMEISNVLALIAILIASTVATALYFYASKKDTYYVDHNFVFSKVTVTPKDNGAIIVLESITPKISVFISKNIYEKTKKTLSSGKEICISLSSYVNTKDEKDIKYQIKSTVDILQFERLVNRCKK